MDRFSILDALLFGPRRMAARPLHATAFAVLVGVAMLAYYSWFHSESGQDWVMGYAYALQRVSSGNFSAFGEMWSYLGLLVVIGVLFGILTAAGAGRILLREDTPWWLPVRISMDEGRYAVISLILVAVYIGLIIAFSILLGILAAVVAIAFAASGMDETTLMVLMGLLGMTIFLPIVYFMGRFAVAYPMATIDRSMNFSGWKATKGAGWSLFAANVLVYVVWMVAFYLINPEAIALSLDAMQSGGAAMNADDYADQFNASIPDGPRAAVSAFITGIGYLVLMGPTAYAGDRFARGRGEIQSSS